MEPGKQYRISCRRYRSSASVEYIATYVGPRDDREEFVAVEQSCVTLLIDPTLITDITELEEAK